MTFARIGVRLGRRRTVTGVAIFAAIFCGLGSCIMQELAHSQRQSYNDQVAFIERADADGQATIDPNAVAAYGRQTDALGARARALQTAGGSVLWAQAWLVTLLGVASLMVAVALTTAADVEARRLVAGWHPARSSRRALLVTSIAGAYAAMRVALGALLGSVLAAVVGGRVWQLGTEPRQVDVEGLGPVALLDPSLGWLLAWIGLVGAAILISWFAGRTLVAILAGGGFFAGAALLSDVLPAWFPGVALPSTTGMWFHHRGEVSHLWMWPYTPFDDGGPSLDWSAIAQTDPGSAALVGAAITMLTVVVAAPWAARRTLS